MTGKTHIYGGVTAGLLFLQMSQDGYFGLDPPGCVAIGGSFLLTLVGSLTPDIDLRTSTIGKTLKPVSAVANKMFGHRTLFHGPILYLLLYFILMLNYPQAQMYGIAFLFGVTSHLLLDMLNKVGIPLFYPFSRRFHIANIKTGGKGERIAASLLLIAGVALAITNITTLVHNSM